MQNLYLRFGNYNQVPITNAESSITINGNIQKTCSKSEVKMNWWYYVANPHALPQYTTACSSVMLPGSNDSTQSFDK